MMSCVNTFNDEGVFFIISYLKQILLILKISKTSDENGSKISLKKLFIH